MLQHRIQLDKRVVETSDVKESNTMNDIASNTSFLPKTHTKKGAAVMNRDESHRQGRGLSFPPGRSSAADSRTRAAARQERVMIDRRFVNCPRLRHSPALALLYFQ
jgi:hypothetical protein